MKLHREWQFRGRQDNRAFILQLRSRLQRKVDDLIVRLCVFDARRLGLADAHRQNMRSGQPTDEELSNRQHELPELCLVLDLAAVRFKTCVFGREAMRYRLPELLDDRNASIDEL